MPAPRRSATTTMLRVGSLSRSIGWTIKNLTPSRSGVFFVDQTVPTTFPRNIRVWSLESGVWSPSHVLDSGLQTPDSRLCLREDLRGLAHVAGGGGDDGARVRVNLLALLDGAAHVVLADEVHGLATVRLRAGSLRGPLRLGRLRAGHRAAAFVHRLLVGDGVLLRVAAAAVALRGRRGFRVRGRAAGVRDALRLDVNARLDDGVRVRHGQRLPARLRTGSARLTLTQEAVNDLRDLVAAHALAERRGDGLTGGRGDVFSQSSRR